MQFNQLTGMQKFTLIWFGTLISLFGTATTRFALLIWAYQQTGQATTTALLGFFSFSLFILISPLAGVLVDRWDRRVVMIVADLGAAMMTLIMLLIYSGGGLEIWHLYIAGALTGAFEAFHVPAYAASTTMLVSKEQYGRVSGMRSLALDSSQVFGPFFAGLILGVVGIGGVMLIDIATFLLGIVPLLFIRIPRPSAAPEQDKNRSMWGEISLGFRYIFARPGLRGLLMIFIGVNLAAALTYYAILAPMVLARTGGDELALGSVQAALGIGGVAGGIVMSIWGGPKRRIHGVLLYGGLAFLLGDFLLAVGQTPAIWMLGAFVGTMFVPFIVGSDRAIWQSKVPPAIQGRVFSVQSMFRQITLPVGYLVAGPLADRLLEPAMMPGGTLAGVFGNLVGTGPGAGMGLMFIGTCILGTVVCFSGYLFPSIRNVEADLPDHSSSESEPALAEAAA